MQTDDALNVRTSHMVGLDLMGSAEQLRSLSREADMARAQADHLEHIRKVRLAEIRESERARLAREGVKVTEARLDDLARASKLYQTHLDAILYARESAAEKWGEYSSLKAALDVACRQLSYLQTEMRRLEVGT